MMVKETGHRLSIVAAMAVGLSVIALAFAPEASAQISGTKHNLSSSQVAPNNRSTESEICVFCHTPHGSATSAQVPLWNRALAAPASYTTYSDIGGGTLDGTVLAVGSISLACLSCHDGTQALDTVLNAPGSGGYNASGARIAGLTWSGANVDIATGKLAAGIVSNLGTDLSNDHPIGIQYGGYNPGAGQIDPDFTAVTKHATLNRWWVDTASGTAGARDKTDMILYTRTNGAAEQPFVECASCHDPHSSNGTFLRIANTGSAVCLACHDK